MRGKYKRKRLERKYKPIIEFGRNNPVEFAERYLSVKLFWYQKVLINRSFGLRFGRCWKCINLSAKCNCCLKQDVCKFQSEYTNGIAAILNSSYSTGESDGFEIVKNSKLIEVSIKCTKFAANPVSQIGIR